MKRVLRGFFLFLFIFFSFSLPVLARIGVGVGTGKIQVEETLRPGIIYELPILTVVNTGDEPADYGVAVAYHQDQPELEPPLEWFIFDPSTFHLEPGKAQAVKVRLNLPIKTVPGKYFAYLEGHPMKKSDGQNTQIGIAAAAKLYFTVAPANLVLGIYYRGLSFWKIYSPWPKVVTVILALISILVLFRRFFKIQINIKKKDEPGIKGNKNG